MVTFLHTYFYNFSDGGAVPFAGGESNVSVVILG